MTRLSIPTDPRCADILLLVHEDICDTPRIRAVPTHVIESIHAVAPKLQPTDTGKPNIQAIIG
ncbi:hypothetical protein [Methylobacterium sp. J-077]|uniref:hypothetical protein n=1 Tax=Methylobacterium sp. J-077 TaxID=2836656 RepID=UPI001FBAF846|nr:hypothetical protein [Methylobacterium sp. J-077]MCJ2121907.1 hypothetical protein [Methylobacterium sp. J-077]